MAKPVSEVFSGTFECRRCSYEAAAQVTARGGRTFMPNAPVEGGATRPVGETTSDIAGVVASRTLMFVRCPRCGERDPSARIYKIQVALGALLAGVASTVLYALGSVKTGLAFRYPEATLVLSGVTGLAAAAMVYRTYRRAWVDVEARVVLSPPASSPATRPSDTSC